MKAFLNNIKPIVLLFISWRLLLSGIDSAAHIFFPIRTDFLGVIPWSNFDGVHYLRIAQEGYRQYLEAFFPLYPLFIRNVSIFLNIAPVYSALFISHTFSLIAIIVIYKLAQLYDKKNALWAAALFLTFPTSFFLVSAYSEGVYIFFSGLTLFFIVKHKWGFAGVTGFLGSATRIFGVFLFFTALYEYLTTVKRIKLKDLFFIGVMPFGLISYMAYLWYIMGDPLAFFHVQPLFGANRSGSELIFLPQVIWRYVKILISVPPTTFLYQIAVLEFLSFIFILYLLIKSWQLKLPRLYIVYSILVVITPTLTGTLSSFPRYLLSAFPLFFVLGKFPFHLRVLVVMAGVVSLVYFTAAFLRGYFVA